MTTHEHWKESHSMSVLQFAEYYEGSYPQAFVVDRVPTGHALWEGQTGIACNELKVQVLKATVFLKDGKKNSVVIPINLSIHFALLPAENSERFSGHPRLLVKDIVHPRDKCVPKAVRVIEACTNSKKQPVPGNEILYNITLVKKMGRRAHGFTGTSANGVRHTFHEGDSTAQFSSRLGDNKAVPSKFYNHITFPQRARVYLKEGEECRVEGLDHLCIVEFTGRDEQHFLAIKTNIDDPESHECQAVPLDLDILLSAVTLKGYPLDKLTLKDRKMIKQLSTENVIQPTGNFYVSKPTDPSIRDEPDPIPPRQPTPPTSRRQSQTSIGRSQSVRVDRKPSLMQEKPVNEYYNWPPEDTEMASKPPSRKESRLGVIVYPHGCANSEQCLTTSVESSQEYSYVVVGFPTQGQMRTPPNPLVSLHHQVPPHVQPHLQLPGRRDEEHSERCTGDNSTQPVNIGHTPAQHKASKSSPVAPPKPPQSPRVPRKTVKLTSRPAELELRYCIADKLGQDWRSVGSYLGLQQHQLDEASEAHRHLKEKAMEALVMWLRGKGDSKERRSWATVLTALRRAGQNDMACELERDIRDGKLQFLHSNGNESPSHTL